MDIKIDQYNHLLELLRSGKRDLATKYLVDITQTSTEDASSIIDQVMVNESISPTSSQPRPPVPKPTNAVKSARSYKRPSSPQEDVSQNEDKVWLDIAPVAKATPSLKRPSFVDHIIAGLTAPLLITSIVGAIMAFLSYFLVKAFLKNKELDPFIKWGGIVAMIFFPYLIYFGLIHKHASPYMSGRDTVVELPKYLNPSNNYTTPAFDQANYIKIKTGFEVIGAEKSYASKALGLPIEKADKHFIYNGDKFRLQIKSIGLRESSFKDETIRYFNIFTNEEIGTDTDKRDRKHEYQDQRLLCIKYQLTSGYRIGSVSLVERKTNKLVANEYTIQNGAILMDLRTWHAAEWDLYIEVTDPESMKTYVPIAEGEHPLGDKGKLQIVKVFSDGSYIARVVPVSLARYTSILYLHKKEITKAEGPEWFKIKKGYQIIPPRGSSSHTAKPELKDCKFKVTFTVPTMVKVELPYLTQLDADPDEKNLLDIKIPYYKLRYGGPRVIQNKNDFLSRLHRRARRLVEDVAQMALLKVDPKIYEMSLPDPKDKAYENFTPYQILKDYADQNNLSIIVDEKNRILSLKYN